MPDAREARIASSRSYLLRAARESLRIFPIRIYSQSTRTKMCRQFHNPRTTLHQCARRFAVRRHCRPRSHPSLGHLRSPNRHSPERTGCHYLVCFPPYCPDESAPLIANPCGVGSTKLFLIGWFDDHSKLNRDPVGLARLANTNCAGD